MPPKMDMMGMPLPAGGPAGAPAAGPMGAPTLAPTMAPKLAPMQMPKPKAKSSDSSSVFAPFGFDSKGKPIMTPPPGWKYFAMDGTPVAPAPSTGGWSEADRAQQVFGPEVAGNGGSFDAAAEGADLYEKGLLPADKVFLPVGVKLSVPLTTTKGKAPKVQMAKGKGKTASKISL